MNYKVDDKNLDVSMFISFVNQVWQSEFDKRCGSMRKETRLEVDELSNKRRVIF